VPALDATRPPTFVEQARRAHILDAAVEVIADEGPVRATFARIAERAGISPGLISYHFGSKAELFREVASRVSSWFTAALEERIEGAESYADALRRLVEAHVGLTTGGTPQARAVVALRGAADIPGTGTTQGERRDWIDQVETMLREGQDGGEFADFEPRPLAMAIVAALEGAPADVGGRPDTDPAAYAKALADVFVAAAVTPRSR